MAITLVALTGVVSGGDADMISGAIGLSIILMGLGLLLVRSSEPVPSWAWFLFGFGMDRLLQTPRVAIVDIFYTGLHP